MAVTVTKQINANNITFTLSGSGSVALNTANTYSDRDLILKILSDGGGDDVFDANGNLNVPGDITTNGHSSPIGTVLSNSTDTAATMSTTGTWVSKTGCSLTLEPGTWVIKVQGVFRGYTTATGTTNATAGNRIVGIGYNDGTTSATYNGCRADTYVPAGRAAYVQAVVIRNLTSTHTVYPVVQTSTAVGFMSARIEAVRIA